jgi:hypothetical protein
MGKAARSKVAKKAGKVKQAVSDAPKVLSKGQRVRREKRDSQVWKKRILESVTRNKNIDQVGQAFGTLDELATAIGSTELEATTNPNAKPKKSKGCLRQSALFAQRVRDLEAIEQICNFQPFASDPVGTIQAHLRNVAAASQQK